jgi:hypothetical protein
MLLENGVVTSRVQSRGRTRINSQDLSIRRQAGGLAAQLTPAFVVLKTLPLRTVTYIVEGVTGSIIRSAIAEFARPELVLVQVPPPFMLLKTPFTVPQ